MDRPNLDRGGGHGRDSHGGGLVVVVVVMVMMVKGKKKKGKKVDLYSAYRVLHTSNALSSLN